MNAAVPALLTGRNLTGKVITLDALHTVRATARQIRAQNGHYLMIVKKNQAALYREFAQERAEALREMNALRSERARRVAAKQSTGSVDSRIARLQTQTAVGVPRARATRR